MNNNSTNYYDFIYKILLLGDSSVGKTCFLLRYADDTFNDNHISTIGLDYRLKMVNLDNDKIVKMQIWDTAGQDRFRAITKNYYKGAHGIILMYDITSQVSFNNIKNWVSQIKENTSDKVKIVLVGNKCDIENQRKIPTEEGEKLAKEYSLKFFETSAKKNICIEETFGYLTKEIYNLNSKNEVPGSNKNGVTLEKTEKKGLKKMAKNCCSK
jgi:small GTP-binding protein